MKEFLSIKEIQDLFSVSRATVNRWIKEDVFPNAFHIGGTVRIPVSDIEALKKNKKETA